MATVRFERVSRRFGKKTVLHEVSFEVPDGQLWVILGPSGSGKSTLLRLVAGLEEPTSGDIFIGDRRVTRLSPRERDVAFVFQSYALYPHMTVFDNIAFPLKVAGMDRATRATRVARVAQLLEIEDLLERKPRELSGGQRQRVAIGRAVVREPQVFLFDEPLSNLDARLRASTRLELVKLHRRLATTTLYVTHDQEEAMTVGHRIAIVHDGRLQQLGTPAEIYHRPANRFVAGFIGTPPMNFIDGHVENGRFHAADLELRIDAPLPPGAATVGIRPEHLTIARSPADDTPGSGKLPRIDGKVEVVEELGSERHVHIVAGPCRLTMVQRQQVPLHSGEAVQVEIDFAAAHWFGGGERIDGT